MCGASYHSTRGEQEEEDTASKWTVPSSGPMNFGSSLVSVDKMQGIRSSSDLRQAIMQLQYLCHENSRGQSAAGNGDIADPPSEAGSTHLRTAIEKAERRSICDAILTRPFQRAIEVSIQPVHVRRVLTA